MATFQTKTSLPITTQQEIDRVSAIPSGSRSLSETSFLTALSSYITNEILELDATGLVLEAAGNTLPTGLTGFKKGAKFIKKNASGNGEYHNIGDESSATWDLVDETSKSNLKYSEKTITIAALGTSGTATVVASSLILGWHPETNLDQVVKSISITTTTLTVTLLVAATAETTIKVLVLEP